MELLQVLILQRVLLKTRNQGIQQLCDILQQDVTDKSGTCSKLRKNGNEHHQTDIWVYIKTAE